MRRNTDNTVRDKAADNRPNRVNGDPMQLVPLSHVAEPWRTELEDRMLARQAETKRLQAIRGKGGITDAGAIPSDPSGYVKRDKPSTVVEREPKPQPVELF